MRKLDLEVLLKNAFLDAFSYKGNNKNRSALFVSKIAEALFSDESKKMEKESLVSCFQRFDERRHRRISGEWLLDIVIAKQTKLHDPIKKRSKAKIITEIIWAVESESDTGLDQFARDFGKLICINSKNYLYLNGMDQLTEKKMKSYVKRRLETIEKSEPIFKRIKEIDKPFFLGFWPVPKIWKKYDKEDLLKNIFVKSLK